MIGLRSKAYRCHLRSTTLGYNPSRIKLLLANADLSKANSSVIALGRTNDFAFSAPWQLREFRLLSGGLPLKLGIIKRIPHYPQYNTGGADNGPLADYIRNEASAILSEAYSVPEQYAFCTGVEKYLTGHVNCNFGDFWIVPVNAAVLPAFFPSRYETALTTLPAWAGIECEVLHKMLVNTCDDCDSGEPLTTFVHVNWSSNLMFPIPASFSDFVTGAGGVGHFALDPRGFSLI